MTKNEILKIAKPILFNTEMVRAILDGRKTVTRRVAKKSQSPYKKGNILYVRETWCKGSLDYNEEKFYYKADNKIPHCQWCPSIHMPKEAARIFLRVKNVRTERLQDIDGYGILAEGVDNGNSNQTMGKRWENMQRMAFSEIWNSTVKKSDIEKYGWSANPWVWVIEFERV